jgi:hypothetical protein
VECKRFELLGSELMSRLSNNETTRLDETPMLVDDSAGGIGVVEATVVRESTERIYKYCYFLH